MSSTRVALSLRAGEANSRSGVPPEMASALRPRHDAEAPSTPLGTGIAELDAILPGGFLRGQIAELSGPPSCGKRSIALALCGRALGEGLGAAWVDASMVNPPLLSRAERAKGRGQGVGSEIVRGFFPLPSLEAGLPIDRLLVVRVSGAKAACHAAALVLRSPGAVEVLVLDIEGSFTLPDASLARLRHLAEESGCAVLFVTERDPAGPALSTFVSLRLSVEGFHSVRVIKNKFGPVRQTAEVTSDGPNRLRVDSTL